MADPETVGKFPETDQRFAVCMSMFGQKDAGEPLEVKFAALEVKSDDEDDEYLYISGYGSVFNNVDGGGDVVMPGAFKECIAMGRKPKMLFQHDASLPIGVWDEMREDANGLFMKGRISKRAAKGAEVAALVKMGAVDGLSIGYRTKEYEMDMQDGTRKLTKLDLWETSVVTFPMNELAGIYAMKSVEEMSEAEIKRHIERALKAIKISGTEAKAMASAAMKGRENVLRDAGVALPETDQREVDELKALLTETLKAMETQNV
jgi:HK97 family phage prohead protease